MAAREVEDRHRTHCEHCGGTGRRPLSERMMKTLDAVTEEWSDTGELTKRLKSRIGKPALSNRLAVLSGLDLVESALLIDIRGYSKPGDGGAKVWRRKQPKNGTET